MAFLTYFYREVSKTAATEEPQHLPEAVVSVDLAKCYSKKKLQWTSIRTPEGTGEGSYGFCIVITFKKGPG